MLPYVFIWYGSNVYSRMFQHCHVSESEQTMEHGSFDVIIIYYECISIATRSDDLGNPDQIGHTFSGSPGCPDLTKITNWPGIL